LEYTHYDLPGTDDLRAKTGLSDLTPTFLMGAISYTEAASMKTWYIRDASGNVLATYEKRGEGSAAPKETMIYGSGRIGMYRHDFMKTRADEDYITGAEARNAYEDKDYQLLPGGSMQLMAGFTFDATTGPRAFEVRTTNGDELFGASQYELTDHLGNVRIGLVDEEGSAITFDATMEADKAEEESQYFMNTDTRHMDPMFNHTAAGAYSSRLNPYLEGGSAIGPAIYLEVSPGDTVAMEVFARYTAQVSDANNVAPALASAIAAGFGGQSPINEAVTLGEAFTEALAAGAAVPTDAGSTAPKAYLQYILFNKNMSMAQHGHHMVSEEAGSSWQHLQLRVPIEEIGYIYIYVANESMDNVDVYFDDLEVQLIDGPVTSASDYYPFGLAMAGRSYTSEKYRFGYQGQFAELDEETGWNSFELRMYSSIIGRWLIPDPMRQYFNPYLAMGNNPIRRYDPNGGEDLSEDPETLALSEQYAISAKQTFADKLWNALWELDQLFENGGGYQYMSNSGSGLGFNEFAREGGYADRIIMDPTTGLVVFKGVNGKVFKWDGRTPPEKGLWEPLKQFIDYAGNTTPALKNAVDGVNLILDYASQSYHKSYWGENGIPGKPRYLRGDKGTIFLDSIPVNSSSRDTLDVNVLKKSNGWKNTPKLYELMTN
jgi:RHS repeat-associated protein